MSEQNPYAPPQGHDPIPPHPSKPQIPRFRWRVVAVTLSGFFGSAVLLGSSAKAGLMIWAYFRFGRFPIDPNAPSLNELAITPKNLWELTSGIGMGVLLLAACVASWRKLRAGTRGGIPKPGSSKTTFEF